MASRSEHVLTIPTAAKAPSRARPLRASTAPEATSSAGKTRWNCSSTASDHVCRKGFIWTCGLK